MTERKRTPDVLSEILGGEIAEPAASETLRTPAPARPRRASKPKAASTSQQASKSVGKWEYRLVSFQDHYGWRPRFVDGIALANWTEGPLMHAYLASLGEEGWELASACSGEKLYGHNDKYQLYFKRLK
jgi:hypothetical protein